MSSRTVTVEFPFAMIPLIFITLKLTGVIAWSWLWVLAPIWIPIVLIIIIIAIGVAAGGKLRIRRK